MTEVQVEELWTRTVKLTYVIVDLSDHCSKSMSMSSLPHPDHEAHHRVAQHLVTLEHAP